MFWFRYVAVIWSRQSNWRVQEKESNRFLSVLYHRNFSYPLRTCIFHCAHKRRHRHPNTCLAWRIQANMLILLLVFSIYAIRTLANSKRFFERNVCWILRAICSPWISVARNAPATKSLSKIVFIPICLHRNTIRWRRLTNGKNEGRQKRRR